MEKMGVETPLTPFSGICGLLAQEQKDHRKIKGI